MKHKQTVIIGGGVIGLSIGWQLARAGEKVILFERDVIGSGASLVAAGMLSPDVEAGYEDHELLQFGLKSRKLYPRFLQEIESDSGRNVWLGQGSLVVALGRDDEEALRRVYHHQVKLGLGVQWLTGGEARAKEPLLSPQIVSAVWLSDDQQVDPHELLPALKLAFLKKEGTLREQTGVDEILIRDGKIAGVRIQNESIECSRVILTAGAWSSEIAGLPSDIRPPMRPIKGQIISLQGTPHCKLSHVIHAPLAYLVPKKNGRLIVGATSEEAGYDLSNTVGAVLKLLEGAYEAVPAVFECVLEAIESGLRPGTRDNLPILGETEITGLYYATGHFRNGILLAPITAYEMTNLVMHGTSGELAPFSPSRFRNRGCVPS